MKVRFKHVWKTDSPTDLWEGTVMASENERQRVLANMKALDDPRLDIVGKFWFPCEVETIPFFVAKAENNGTCYFFCDTDIFSYVNKSWTKL